MPHQNGSSSTACNHPCLAWGMWFGTQLHVPRSCGPNVCPSPQPLRNAQLRKGLLRWGGPSWDGVAVGTCRCHERPVARTASD
eukprot:7717799-Alexandrium_andersonii.AAC.1